MQTTKTKSGCGCGGGCGGGASSGCGCKPAKLLESAQAACDPCETTAFVRPRFFAGQLLTEDDLSALVDYVVAKGRFHNARLFGEGVVCGLLVECGPCAGQVVVDAGYALDCCGNDLVLTCDRTIDLAPMIRALAHDCTDPCKQAGDKAVLGNSTSNQKPTTRKQYDLYIKYAERQSDPVAAYPVGDDCDAANCEPTRVVEGVTFELRCPADREYPSYTTSVKACIEKYYAKEMLSAATSWRDLASRYTYAFEAHPAELSENETRLLAEAAAPLDDTIGMLKGADRVTALTRFVTTIGGPLTRVSANSAAKKSAIADGELVRKNVSEAVALLAKSLDDAATPLDREIASAAVANWHAVTGENPDTRSPVAKAFMFGAPASSGVLEAARDQMRVLASKLRKIPGCGANGVHADCALKDALAHLEPTFNTSAESANFELAGTQLLSAAQIMERLLEDCWCAAVNPPCPPCDDPAVLLARITVDGCHVISICNSVRRYVTSPMALHYWYSEIVPDQDRCSCDQRRRFAPVGSNGFYQAATAARHDAQLRLERLSTTGDPTLALRAQLQPPKPAEAIEVVRGGELDDLRAKLADYEKRIAALEGGNASVSKKGKPS